MFIRNMTTDDFDELVEILLLEGISTMTYITPKNTFVFQSENGDILGFFSIRIENSMPTLWHFVVKKEMRTMEITRMLIKSLKLFVRNMGFPMFIVAVKKDRLKRFVKYFAKNRKQYAETEGVSFYLVEV